MKLHTTDADVDGLLLSSGTFIPVLDLEVTLNIRNLSISTKNGKVDLGSLSPEDKGELYDYIICRWIAAKNACFREVWASVAEHN